MIGIILIIITLLALFYYKPWENYANYFRVISADANQSNQNAFGNYYRIGFHENEKIGWKPSETWEYLRPEANVIPQCYDKVNDSVYDH